MTSSTDPESQLLRHVVRNDTKPPEEPERETFFPVGESELNFFAAIIQLDMPFIIGDLMKVAGEEFDDEYILTNLEGLVRVGMLERIDERPAYNLSRKFPMDVTRSATNYMRVVNGLSHLKT